MAGMLVAFLIWVKAALNLLIDKENSPRARAFEKEGWTRLLVAPQLAGTATDRLAC
jgi:hypothetical protein